MNAERRIFFGQLLQSDRELVLIGLRLRLDRDVDDRRRKLHRFENDRLVFVAIVSPVRVSRSPIAAAMSPQRTSSISSRLFACICSRRPTRSRLSFVALYTYEPLLRTPEYTRKNVSLPTNGSVAILNASPANGASSETSRVLDHLVVIGQMSLNRRHVERRRQIVDHRVEQRLNALVLERCAAQHRNDVISDRRDANRMTDLIHRELGATEVLLEQRVVVRDSGFDHLVTCLLRRVLELLGNVDDLKGLAERLVVKDVLLALDDVDVTGERLTVSDWKLNRIRLLGQAIADHRQAAIEVRARTVHLVREDQTRNAITISLAPHRLRLRLYTRDRIEQRQRRHRAREATARLQP